MFLAIVATMALAVAYLINLFFLPGVPWALAPATLGLVLWWRYLNGSDHEGEEAERRRRLLRWRPLSITGWCWAFLAIASGLIVLAGLGGGEEASVASAAILPDFPFAELGSEGWSLTTIYWVHFLLFVPLIEEAAFRGYMQTPLEETLGTWTAVPLVAVVFSLMHSGRGNPLLYLLLALLLGGLASRSQSILPGILAHSLVNLHGILGEARPEWAEVLSTTQGALPGWLLGLLALVCLGAVYQTGRMTLPHRHLQPKTRSG